MALVLAIYVRLVTPRFHGLPEWPPSPGRLFQALVAGAANPALSNEHRHAFRELEKLAPPLIGAPRFVLGQRFELFVPNNDLDAMGNDLGKIGKIRTAKQIAPRIIDADLPFIYGWSIPSAEALGSARLICKLADYLYQFGRGVDFSWASGEIVDQERFEQDMLSYKGVVYRANVGKGHHTLSCPERGSLELLEKRFLALGKRFSAGQLEGGAKVLYSQPPKAPFAQVTYNSPAVRWTYHLREGNPEASFHAWPLAQAAGLVELLRNSVAGRFSDALPQFGDVIKRYLIGRETHGSAAVKPEQRVRIIALPSIGHEHANPSIRRVMVEVPPSCPLRADDVQWAFSGLSLQSSDSSLTADLTPAGDDSMLQHYGIGDRYRVWQTVTPAVLPQSARRRRIDPLRVCDDAKGAEERIAEESRACSAVLQAVRHAGLKAGIEVARVQREPFHRKGLRAESFAPGTRFEKERLWHVQIEFTEPVEGPLLIGDGRFLGLGLMAPVKTSPRVHAFEIKDGLENRAESSQVTYALRRAVMARVQNAIGTHNYMPSFFTGHERDGSTVRDGRETHLMFVFDPFVPRVLVVAPGASGRHSRRKEEERYLKTLDKSLAGFNVLRAGCAGCLILKPQVIETEHDSLVQRACVWESVTPYAATRHAKQKSAFEALAEDLRSECLADKLPTPEIEILEARGIAGVGLVGKARLRFAVAVSGPILLGKDRFQGGGLFRAVLP